MHHSIPVMDNEVRKFINQIPKNSRITLTGGDPFMIKDFETIFSKVNEN